MVRRRARRRCACASGLRSRSGASSFKPLTAALTHPSLLLYHPLPPPANSPLCRRVATFPRRLCVNVALSAALQLVPAAPGARASERLASARQSETLARQALAGEIVIDGRAIPLSGSMGIAIYPQHGMTLSDLLNSADTAMYEAKANGPGTVRVFGLGEKQ